MACFCDIPLTKITEHIEKYGHYGIGFKGSWKEAKKMTSAIYTRTDSELAKKVKSILYEIYNDKSEIKSTWEDIFILSHIKKHRGKFLGKSESKFNGKIVVFYNEREWRYVPSNLHLENIIITKEDNQTIKPPISWKDAVPFTPADIKHIIIDREAERKEIIDCISHIRNIEESNKKLLISRITSIELMQKDY